MFEVTKENDRWVARLSGCRLAAGGDKQEVLADAKRVLEWCGMDAEWLTRERISDGD